MTDFFENRIVEGGKPPSEVRFTSLKTEPRMDGRRVRVLIDITPFERTPNLLVTIRDAAGEEVSLIHIIETPDPRLVFTMHIRTPESQPPYTLTATLLYPEHSQVDTRSVNFDFSLDSTQS